MFYPLLAATSFFLTLILVLGLIKISLKRNLFITKGIPLVGGIALGLVFILVVSATMLSLGLITKEIIGMLIASTLVLCMGIIDDGKELSIWAKFLVQIAAAGILIAFGVRANIMYIGTYANCAITLLWVVGITNAFNHLDVMDGVAGGVAAIISAAFFALAILNADAVIATLTIVLGGSTLGFLMRNYPPAKVYMGNAGSHFLGFILAAVAIMIRYAPLERKIALLSPLCIMGFPILDTAFLIIMRIAKKTIPFKKSNDHLALRYLFSGHSKKRTVCTMLSVCLFFALSGIALSKFPLTWSIAVLASVAAFSVVLSVKMGRVVVSA